MSAINRWRHRAIDRGMLTHELMRPTQALKAVGAVGRHDLKALFGADCVVQIPWRGTYITGIKMEAVHRVRQSATRILRAEGASLDPALASAEMADPTRLRVIAP